MSSMATSVPRGTGPHVGRADDPCSPQEDDGAQRWGYGPAMSDRVADALLAAALAVALVLQLLLADEPGASAAGVLGGLALTLPLAFRRRAPLAVVLGFAAVALAQEALGGGLYSGQPPLIA